MIVGEFSLKGIICDSPEQLWKQTHKYSGIDKEFFDQYFEGKDKGYALQIDKLRIYKKPINPYLQLDKFYPPQSYMYVDDNSPINKLSI